MVRKMIEADNLPPGKDVKFKVVGQELHIIFESEVDAIEMMPREPGPSNFERRKNIIVMIDNPELRGVMTTPQADD